MFACRRFSCASCCLVFGNTYFLLLRHDFIKVPGLVWACLRPQPVPDHIFQNLLRWLAVALIHCHKEKGHHQPDHQKHRSGISDHRENKLPFRQIKGNFGLNLRQILWNRYIGQKITFFPSNACRCKKGQEQSIFCALPLFLVVRLFIRITHAGTLFNSLLQPVFHGTARLELQKFRLL